MPMEEPKEQLSAPETLRKAPFKKFSGKRGFSSQALKEAAEATRKDDANMKECDQACWKGK